MVLKSEPNTVGDVVLFEEERALSRDVVTILSGEGILKVGSVLGKLTVDTVPAAGTADGGNTGDGTLAVDGQGADLIPGNYIVRCVEAITNSGRFVMEQPGEGLIAEDILVGTAFVSSHLSITLTDGAADFIVGDFFTIAVSGSGKYVLSPDAVTAGEEGGENGIAVLVGPEDEVDATAADAKAVVLARHAIVKQTGLIFEATVNDLAKRNAKRDQLRAVGIQVREGA